MPMESIYALVGICAAFAVFMAILAYSDYDSGGN